MTTDFNLSDKMLLENTLGSIIEHIPAHIYWKDLEGRYLGCNNMQANSLGFQSGKDVVGKTDFELPWPKGFAEEFRENDLEVIQSGEIRTSEENSTMLGNPVIVLSQKVPLKNEFGKVVGVLGISLNITAEKEREQLKTENKSYKIKNEENQRILKFIEDTLHSFQTFKMEILNDKIGTKPKLPQVNLEIKLTKREREILYFLSLNKSPKEIAGILSILENKSLSPLTISSIIDKQLYIKLGVNSVSRLIEVANQLKLIPFSIG